MTDLADAGGAVIGWDTAILTDSAISVGGTDDEEITVEEEGKYRVASRLAYEDVSTEDTDTKRIRA